MFEEYLIADSLSKYFCSIIAVSVINIQYRSIFRKVNIFGVKFRFFDHLIEIID